MLRSLATPILAGMSLLWPAQAIATSGSGAADAPLTNEAAAFDRAYRQLFDQVLTWNDEGIDHALAAKVARMAPPGDPVRSARATAAACLEWDWITQRDAPARIDEARRLAQAAKDQEAMIRLTSCRAARLHHQGEVMQALEQANQGLALAQRSGTPLRLQLHALMTRAAYASLIGDQARALIDLGHAQDMFEQAYPGRSSARLDLDRSIAYRRMGAYTEAWEFMRRYQRSIEPAQDWRQALHLDNELAYLQQESGQPAGALTTGNRMIALAREHDSAEGLVSATKIRAEALAALGRNAEALRAASDFDALPADYKKSTITGLTEVARAQALAGMGRHEAALTALAQAEHLVRGSNIKRYLAKIYELRAASEEALGRHAAALASYREHVAMRDALQQRMELQRITFQRMREEIDAGTRENRALKTQADLRERQMDALLQARRWQYGSLLVGSALLALIMLLLWRQWQRSRELDTLANTDPLTGLANRGAAMKRIQAMIDAGPAPFSLLLADIDHFKSINDLHGHPVGDLVLQAFARRCNELLGERQLFGRWGGEEFVVFCRGDLDAAASLAERLRAGIEAMQVEVGIDRPLALTVSIGATALRPGETEARAAITRADAALYRAKRGGRNRVELDA